MRTTIEIDDEQLAMAMKATGHKTKRATVSEVLRHFIAMKEQEARDKLRAKAAIGGQNGIPPAA